MSEYTRIVPEDALSEDTAVTREQVGRLVVAVNAQLTERGLSQGELARRVGVAASTLSAFLAGEYAGDWRTLALCLDRYFEQLSLTESGDREWESVQTGISDEIFSVARMVLQRGACIGLVHGDSGVGKTTALRMVERKTPGGVFVSAGTAKARMRGLLIDIGWAMHRRIAERTLAETFNRTVDALRCHCRLLIVDEIHKYCGRDDCFDMLRDLVDNSGVPQLWVGTTDLIRYFDRKIGQGREPLSQIRRRILVARDLGELADAEGGAFSTAEIRKLLAAGRCKLDTPATRYMVQLANLRGEGGLGLVKNLYITASMIATRAKTTLITADMLRNAHAFQASRRTRQMVEAKLAAETAAEPQEAKRATA